MSIWLRRNAREYSICKGKTVFKLQEIQKRKQAIHLNLAQCLIIKNNKSVSTIQRLKDIKQ